MYTKQALSQDQCLAAINAVAEAFKKDYPDAQWTLAIVDDGGNLVAFTKSDGAGPLLGRNVIKKAYTSAMTGASTKVFGQPREGESDFAAALAEHDWNVTEWGDPMMMVISGGVAINAPDGSLMGGIGVSGLPYGPGDHDMSLIGIKAMGL